LNKISLVNTVIKNKYKTSKRLFIFFIILFLNILEISKTITHFSKLMTKMTANGLLLITKRRKKIKEVTTQRIKTPINKGINLTELSLSKMFSLRIPGKEQ